MTSPCCICIAAVRKVVRNIRKKSKKNIWQTDKRKLTFREKMVYFPLSVS